MVEGENVTEFLKNNIKIRGIRFDYLKKMADFVNLTRIYDNKAIIFFNSALHYIGDQGNFTHGYKLFKSDLKYAMKVRIRNRI